MKLGTLIKPAKLQKCGNDDYPVLSMTMHNGLVFQSDKFKKSVASQDKSTYKVVHRNQLVIGFPIDEGVLATQRITDVGIVSPAYGIWDVDQTKIIPEFFGICVYAAIVRLTIIRQNCVVQLRAEEVLPTPTLLELDVPLSDIEQQRLALTTIHHAKNALDSRQAQLTKLDELVKARFMEMFGDMLLNSLEWPEKPLEGLADIVSGITKGRKTTETGLIEVPYMAVSNVKSGYIDWTTIKTILATKQEIEQYRLMPDDILMTEGGDPDKVGRGAIIKNPLKDSIHQNHIFRVRLDKSELLPAYFAEYLQHQKAKRYFLGCAKQTTGIASINMRQLRALPVLIPPLPLQNQFADFVAKVDKSKADVQKALDQTQLLFDSLMQQYFG